MTAASAVVNRLGRCATFTGTISRVGSVLERHGSDESWRQTAAPEAVVFAHSVQSVRDVLEACSEARCPVIPYGAGTSLEGHVHAVHGGISLDVSEMTEILEVNPVEKTARVQCGVRRHQLDAHLRDSGLFFPVDPGADASIGGMISTSASGTTTVRYGRTRDNIVGLQAVLPNGAIVELGKEHRNFASAIDVMSLFVGAEGTLGVITEATLRLHLRPEVVRAAVCPFPSLEEAVSASVQILRAGVRVARMEFLDETSVDAVNRYSKTDFQLRPTVFFEFHGSDRSTRQEMETVRAIATSKRALSFETAADADERARLWHARHMAYYATLALRPGFKAMTTDACVPISRLAECIVKTQRDLHETGLLAPILGHVGDGNFHVLLLVDMDNVSEVVAAKRAYDRLGSRAIAMGGTCTGEHGIGLGKVVHLKEECDDTAYSTMIKVKNALDPLGIMNPGKIVVDSVEDFARVRGA